MQEIEKSDLDLIEWLKTNYLYLMIGLLFLYLLIAFTAPIMMKVGYTNIGKHIYRLYSNFCHQYAHRSWFLFGEQLFYPLESTKDIKPLTEVFKISDGIPYATREIIGNEVAGYKVAICQRDVAMYGTLLLFSLIFIISKKKVKRLSFIFWLIFAVFPMGIDGTWQLISSLDFMSHLEFSHESTPLLRSITGGLFGFLSGWLLLPSIEGTVTESK